MPETNKFQKLRASYYREILSKPEPDLVFTSILAVLLTGALWVYAIRPELKSFSETQNKLTQLKTIQNNMEAKINFLNKEDGVTQDLGQNIVRLDNSLPEEIMLNNYLQELVQATAKTGFVIDSLTQKDSYEKTVLLELSLTGSTDNLPELIKGIEDLNRITNIKEVRSQVGDNETVFKIIMEIYTS